MQQSRFIEWPGEKYFEASERQRRRIEQILIVANRGVLSTFNRRRRSNASRNNSLVANDNPNCFETNSETVYSSSDVFSRETTTAQAGRQAGRQEKKNQQFVSDLKNHVGQRGPGAIFHLGPLLMIDANDVTYAPAFAFRNNELSQT